MDHQQRKRRRLQLWSALLGNLFEHYDTALFGFLSPFLSPLLFPQEDPLMALLLTYAIIPLGMIVRPLGALVFGYIGDVYGRTRALFMSLWGMAALSGVIACIPLYAQVGFWAPLLFVVSRAMQNFFASGEVMGGAIFSLENTDETKQDLLSSLFGASTIGGILLACFGVAVLGHYEIITSYWRYLYAFGCVTALCGCTLRRKGSIVSSVITRPCFAWKRLFTTHKKALILIMVTSGFSYATYSLSLILLNGFIPLVSSWTQAEMMGVNTGLLVLDFIALPCFGWLSSKISRKKLMLSSSIGAAVVGIPLCFLLPQASFFGLLAIRSVIVLLGVAFYAPFHAWAKELVPPGERYAVISLGYALGAQVFGGPTTVISLWLFKETKNVSSVAWWWVLLALISTAAVALSHRKELASTLNIRSCRD